MISFGDDNFRLWGGTDSDELPGRHDVDLPSALGMCEHNII